MNTYYRYWTNHFILFVWLACLVLSAHGQAVHVGDSITLNALDYAAGELQWQYSFDDEQWFDYDESTGLMHVIYPEQDIYLRLRITDPDCPPAYYTEVKFVEVAPKVFACGDSLVDPRDGQVYPTIKIGDQCWMGTNLNIGHMIEGANNQLDTAVIEKYCYGDDPENCDRFGGLYQWNQVMGYTTEEGAQGICLPGWHVPSDEEWKTLEMALGMSENAVNMGGFRGVGIGDALKEGGSSGFEALMGGARNNWGGWQFIEGSDIEFGYFYTSTEGENPNNAYRRCLRKDHSAVGRYSTWPKMFGLSLRCVKD